LCVQGDQISHKIAVLAPADMARLPPFIEKMYYYVVVNDLGRTYTTINLSCFTREITRFY
jgi:hypothetical protein